MNLSWMCKDVTAMERGGSVDNDDKKLILFYNQAAILSYTLLVYHNSITHWPTQYRIERTPNKHGSSSVHVISRDHS